MDRSGQGVEQPAPVRNRFLFGTALPDFAAIGRFQLQGDPDDPAVAAGVDLHHATDNAFHGSEWFVANSQAVRERLEKRGINRGAARACGHVGVELLLDGHLLATHSPLRAEAEGVLELADDGDLGLSDLVTDDRRADWVQHLERISTWPLPGDYDQPAAVAERLHRILRSRRRLAFGPEGITIVAETLADRSSDLIAGIDEMVDTVAGELLPTM